MKASIVITVFNEEDTIADLLDSLLNQSQKANEIVIVDAKSEDRTAEIIKHFQKKDKRIKLLIEKCSRAIGRNIGIEISRNEIIAMTDAGCIAKNDWLEKIVEPLKEENIGVTAGFYDMMASNSFEKACRRFLGVYPDEFDIKYLPSARSIALKKTIWEKVGGFPENLKGAAEDTVFNYKLSENNIKIAREKDARVEWEMPKTRKAFFDKIKNYAKGDIKSGLIWNPAKGLSSHNIKAFSIIFRYLLFLSLLIISTYNSSFLSIFLLILMFYSIFAFMKVYKKEGDIKVGINGIINQYISDLAVMSGVISGIKDNKS